MSSMRLSCDRSRVRAIVAADFASWLSARAIAVPKLCLRAISMRFEASAAPEPRGMILRYKVGELGLEQKKGEKALGETCLDIAFIGIKSQREIVQEVDEIRFACTDDRPRDTASRCSSSDGFEGTASLSSAARG